jgi:hypothetical protein
MTDEVYIEKGAGRTLSINVRLFTNDIAERGAGFVKPGNAWFKGDVGFRPNKAHGVPSIGSDPIMFNRPEDLVSAIFEAAKAQGVTLFDPATKERLV